MIDIIIPAYNAHNTIREALYSILIQNVRSMIKVYIVDDCSVKNYNNEIKGIEDLIDIKILKTPKNSGPGVARQYGIEHSDSEYIMFLDADDMFYNCFSVINLYDYISQNGYNAVCSDSIEECGDDIIRHGFNDIWVHGKIYRRSFIEKNNIKFSNTFSNEDTGFNHIISLLDEFNYLPEITYVWKMNPNSITRINDYEFAFNSLEGYIDNICYSIEKALKNKADINKVSKLIVKTMYEIYFNYLKYLKDPTVNVNKIFKWSKKLKKLYLQNVNNISFLDKSDAIEEEFHRWVGIGKHNISIIYLLDDEFSFKKFLDNIDKKHA